MSTQITTLTPEQIYDLLLNLRDVDYTGTKTSSEAVELRKKLSHEFKIIDKEIVKICKYASLFYKKNGSQIGSRIRSGKNVVESIKELEDTNLNIAIAGYVFYENLEAKKLAPFRNLSKFSKLQRDEIFNSEF